MTICETIDIKSTTRRNMMKSAFFTRCLGLLLLPLLAATVQAQEINLDRMEKCGDLICYQSLKETDVYYYLPDQPRLATKNGRPQFSFLKYARTAKTGEAGTGRAEGGGIVHFLVTYGADQGRVKAAEKGLQEKHPDARIAGPIVYRKGSFALVTSFQEGNEITTRTVAVGKAPLMEGQKTAVSMALTREGAELLWESFQSDTPDISLVFDMEFAGVREPYEATLEADWSRISNHQRVKAGVKYSWFGADVDLLFQELRQTGAVKITTKGESAALDKILDSANNKLLQVMFDPSPTDDLSRAAAENNSYSSLNQAVQMLRNAAGSSSSSSGTTRRTSFLPLNLELLWAGMSHYLISVAHAGETDTRPALQPSQETQSRAMTEQVPLGTGEQLSAQEQRSRQAFQEANGHFQAGRFEQALTGFREALQLYEQVPNPRDDRRAALINNVGQALFRLGHYQEAAVHLREAADLWGHASTNGSHALTDAETAERLAREGDTSTAQAVTALNDDMTASAPAETAAEAYNRARRLYDEARNGGYQSAAVRQALEAYEGYQRDHQPTGSRGEEVAGRIRLLRDRLGSDTSAQTSATASAPAASSTTAATALPDPFAGSGGTSATTSTTGTAGQTGSSTASATSASSASGTPASGSSSSATAAASRPASGSAASRRSNNTPGFSLVASYQMKRIKRSGKLVYQMNQYRTENQAFAMAENIGSLFRRYGRDPQVFRAVTIDDPVFKQREILVTLDGQDAENFSKHLNFVTVKLKKRHQSGETTNDEVVITPEKFNGEGNAFSLAYGYKGDEDRNAWLAYDYETLWSFHGGVEVHTPMQHGDSPMLALQAPHRYRTVTFEGEGAALTAAGVRHAVVTVTSRLAGREMKTQATIRNSGPAPSLMLDIPEDPENPQLEVSITWYLTGGRQVTAPVRTVAGDIIYWDEVPGQGA
jgi:tetratricopeptide (TPR) repeat protein